MATNAEALARELADREKVREVLYRYCWSVDRATIDDVMALFADPCDLELVPGRRYEGKAAVRAWYDRYIQHRMEALRHLIHNQIITIEGDSAFSKSYFDAVGDLGGDSIVAAGFYHDRLVRSGDDWKFAEKIIRLDFIVPLSQGWGGKKFKGGFLEQLTAE
jgi:ketosteroid isomerase-like protein